jgi:hypothetical protein
MDDVRRFGIARWARGGNNACTEKGVPVRKGVWLIVLLAVVLCGPAAWAQKATAPEPLPQAEGRERNLRAYIELLRRDVRTQKVAVFTEMMQFSDQEDRVFWPVYREHESELARLNDDRIRLVEDYARTYMQLTDTTANDLVTRALDLEARRTALKQKYYARLKTVLPARTAARVIQIENQIQLLVDLQIAASLPVPRDAEEGR